MKRVLFVVSAILLAWATTSLAESVTFTVLGIDCAGCAPPIVKALNSVPGVKTATVDWKAQTATVEMPNGVDREKIRSAVSNAGFGAVFAGEDHKDIEKLPADVIKTLDIVSLTNGKRADIAKLLVPGKITIVDFYGDWCGPCKVLETRIEHLMQGRKDIALRRVDIGKWDNDAAKQATRDFSAEALPYIRVYNARGKFVTSVTGGMWDEVLAAIDKAAKK
jgi:copper chaperone CopZ